MKTFSDLIDEREPPENRVGKATGGLEQHLTEAAVMLAFAMHLFELDPNPKAIDIHPDGEHGKRFDIRGWLERRGFQRATPKGKTSYGGIYRKGDRTITVFPKSGLGDVVAHYEQATLVAECKGGVINTRHSGRLSNLRRGLCEAVGLLIARPQQGERHIAVVPDTDETRRLANRMAGRAKEAGIEIALVSGGGLVSYLSG